MFRPSLALRTILARAERVEKPKKDHRATAVMVAASTVNGVVIAKGGVLSRAGTTLYRAAGICGNRHAELVY